MSASTKLADFPLRQVGPRWPAEGTLKVQRGGSYLNNPYRLRASFRTKDDPTEHAQNVGVRCAQDVPALP
ncbi:MAG: SUMF1/EgtB/PvdO family nonheme iron enzyme [Nitrospirota bacterium]